MGACQISGGRVFYKSRATMEMSQKSSATPFKQHYESNPVLLVQKENAKEVFQLQQSASSIESVFQSILETASLWSVSGTKHLKYTCFSSGADHPKSAVPCLEQFRHRTFCIFLPSPNFFHFSFSILAQAQAAPVW